MPGPEYTEMFARFILDCRDTYDELCERIDRGELPAGTSAKVTIEVPASTIDEIRKDRLVAIAEGNGHG